MPKPPEKEAEAIRARHRREEALVRKSILQGDAIDFPTSVQWVSYFAERGLTPDFPDAFYRPAVNAEVEDLKRRVAELEKIVAGKSIKVVFVQLPLPTLENRPSSKFSKTIEMGDLKI